MNKFTYVEDYIEIISGYRDPETNKQANHSALWFVFTPIISLARYDVSVLDTMCSSIIDGKALTTKQGELAVKIISKYQRQLATKNVDTTPVLDPKWRIPLRVISYVKKLSIVNDELVLMFPFTEKLIDGLREFRKGSQGKGEWNKERKVWSFDLTEYNLSYLVTWAQANEFEVDSECIRLNDLIIAAENTPYAIELDLVDGELTIKNAANSLIEYINEHCGGFGIDNLPKLVDLSSVLAYTVSDSIKALSVEQNSDVNFFLSTNSSTKFAHDDYSQIEKIMDYADCVGRWPVIVYEPDNSNKMLTHLWIARGRENVFSQRGKQAIDEDTLKNFKYIHTTTPIKNIKIPLLVSTAGMLFGGNKSLMLQNTEKCVYFSVDVHTNNKSINIPLYGEEHKDQ